jgi:hypothetical protein
VTVVHVDVDEPPSVGYFAHEKSFGALGRCATTVDESVVTCTEAATDLEICAGVPGADAADATPDAITAVVNASVTPTTRTRAFTNGVCQRDAGDRLGRHGSTSVRYANAPSVDTVQ